MKKETILDFQDYLKILKGRAALIIVITLLAAITAGLLSYYVITPVYMAKTSVVVGAVPNGENGKLIYDDVIMYQKLMKTFGEIARSSLVSSETAKKIKGGITSDVIQSSVSIDPQVDTQILIIKAQNSDPEKARIISDTLTECFIAEASKIYPLGNFAIVDKAKTPAAPIKPNNILNILIGFMIGLSLSVGIVFLLEYLDNSIKNTDDLQKYFGFPVLGLIPLEK